VVKCDQNFCNWKGKLEDYRLHYNEHFSEKNLFKCEYCTNEYESLDELKKHIDKINGDCKKQPIECIYHNIGCNKIEILTSDGRFIDIDEENEENENVSIFKKEQDNIDETMEIEKPSTSSKLNYNSNKKLNKENNKNTNKCCNYYLTRETFNYHMEKNLIYHLNLLKIYSDEQKLKLENIHKLLLDCLKDENKSNINKLNVEFLKNSSEINTKEDSLSIRNNFKNEQDEYKLDKYLSKVNLIENTQNNILNDINRLVKVNDKLKQENNSIKEINKEFKQLALDLHKTLTLNQVSLLALEERLINQEKLSTDGTYLWKITNLQEKMQEAKSGRQTSFYSPPFYTSRNGYKMCIRIYLNGDGNGRNTHLSLFFVILRGEYDALLRWPFRQKVSFILYDQSSSESKENIHDAFRPDPSSSSFKRPTSEMNIASGLPLFCPLAKLFASDHEYIKDNTLFIKTIVDISDLPAI
jgi:hypothetical protein